MALNRSGSMPSSSANCDTLIQRRSTGKINTKGQPEPKDEREPRQDKAHHERRPQANHQPSEHVLRTCAAAGR